jgi:hypothetical protein
MDMRTHTLILTRMCNAWQRHSILCPFIFHKQMDQENVSIIGKVSKNKEL